MNKQAVSCRLSLGLSVLSWEDCINVPTHDQCFFYAVASYLHIFFLIFPHPNLPKISLGKITIRHYN